MKLVPALVALVALQAFSVAVAKPKKAIRPASYSRGEDSSAPTMQRDSRQGHVGVAATAGFLYVGGGGGVEAWYNTRENAQLGLQLASVKGELDAYEQNPDSDKPAAEYLSLSLSSAKLDGRWFVFHSFYLVSGLSYDTVDGKYGFRLGKNGNDFLGSNYKATMVLGHVGLGNQWRLRNGIILGGEWAALVLPLSTTVERTGDASHISATPAAGVEDSDPDAFKSEVKKKLNDQIKISLAMLKFGYEF